MVAVVLNGLGTGGWARALQIFDDVEVDPVAEFSEWKGRGAEVDQLPLPEQILD